MNDKSSIFQMILIGVFIVGALIAVLLFSGIIPGFNKSNSTFAGNVVIWGSIPQNQVSTFINEFKNTNKDKYSISYIYKNPATLAEDLVGTLARGSGPDLVFISDSDIYPLRDFIEPISYSRLPIRDFRNVFIEGSEIFTNNQGVIALPLSVDPLVLYYNRDSYTKKSILQAPQTWSEYILNHQKLTTVDNNSFISSSGTAFGEFSNVPNAKEILIALIMQVGGSFTTLSTEGIYKSGLNGSSNHSSILSAIDFFTHFSMSGKAEYSWNKSLPNAKSAFSSGFLANYFGFASELKDLQTRNPNLNLDVTNLPQVSLTTRPLTYGHFTGIAILRSSRNKNTAISVAFDLANKTNAAKISELSKLPPARRDLLVLETSDPFLDTFYQSAIFAKSWVDPNPNLSKIVFSNLINVVVTRTMSTEQAFIRMISEFGSLF